MARVKIEEIVDHLSSEMRKALSIAVLKTMPEANFDEHQLFREFRATVRKKVQHLGTSA